jgi:hypothetical protein
VPDACAGHGAGHPHGHGETGNHEPGTHRIFRHDLHSSRDRPDHRPGRAERRRRGQHPRRRPGQRGRRAGGHFHTYPALAILWGSAPVKGHPAERKYTELTLVFTASRPPSYQLVNGKTVITHPATLTLPTFP